MSGTIRLTAPPHDAMEAVVGQVVEGYRVVRRVAAGGMATVFLARHESLGRPAAIKFLDPELGQDPQSSARFFNEARAASLLSHPSIVSIFGFGRLEDGMAYMIMEYLDGESLSARAAREGEGHRQPLRWVRLVRQIATAMAVVHEHGIVHRDLKPQNVMIVPDPETPGGERCKIVDFGIAKLRTEHYHADNTMIETRLGTLLGTALYMSPEQCSGMTDVTAKADVYALGGVFYRLLSGHALFPDTDLPELVRKHRYVEPIPLLRLAPDLPRELAFLVHAMIAKDPVKRPDMAQVANLLEPWEAPVEHALPPLRSQWSAERLSALFADPPPIGQGAEQEAGTEVRTEAVQDTGPGAGQETRPEPRIEGTAHWAGSAGAPAQGPPAGPGRAAHAPSVVVMPVVVPVGPAILTATGPRAAPATTITTRVAIAIAALLGVIMALVLGVSLLRGR